MAKDQAEICLMVDCTSPEHCRGLCTKHYADKDVRDAMGRPARRSGLVGRIAAEKEATSSDSKPPAAKRKYKKRKKKRRKKGKRVAPPPPTPPAVTGLVDEAVRLIAREEARKVADQLIAEAFGRAAGVNEIENGEREKT